MVLALLACLVQLGAQQAPSPQLSAKLLEKVGTILQYGAFVPGVDFSTWDKVSDKHQKELDAAQTAKDYADSLNRALAEYGVSHMFVTPPGAAIGSMTEVFGFDTDQMNGRFVVTRVFAGTEAEQVGLHSGLTLESEVEPDDARIIVSFFDASHILRAKVIHKVSVIPKLKPELIDLDKDGAALEIGDFSEGYDPKQVDDLMTKASKIPNLVIDLRGNIGGFPPNGAHLLGYFLPARTRFGAAISRDSFRDFAGKGAKSTEERAAAVKKVQGSDALVSSTVPGHFPGHIAVLVDRNTRSMGEVVAAALRDFAGAQIFGTPSAGQVLEMIGENLPGGYTMYFPIHDYWTAKGERIEGHPIVPDFPVPVDSEEGGPLRTPLRLKALHWLKLQ